MIDLTIRQIWNALNNAYQATIGSKSLGLLSIIVGLHLLLAIATLGLGNRTICDILKPMRKIFKPDSGSVLDGALEVTIAIPRAIAYYGNLYIHSYVLALRIVLWLWAAAIVALFVPLAMSLGISLIYGYRTPISQVGQVAQLVPLSYWPALAYFYWRFDGRRMVTNFLNAWKC